jgi:hypothetical protein
VAILMPTLALITALAFQATLPADTAAAYVVILEQIRAEHPGLPVVLAETRSGVACMPHCGARAAGGHRTGDRRDTTSSWHSAEVIRQLRDAGLVQATCEVPERTFGCTGYPGHLFVALGEMQESPPRGPRRVDGGLWVKAAILVPGKEPCLPRDPGEPYYPDGFGYWFLLVPQEDGAWKSVKRLPAFFL